MVFVWISRHYHNAMMIILLLWHSVVWLGQVPSYIFPSPLDVLKGLPIYGKLVLAHAVVSIGEMLLGLFIAITLGMVSALLCVIYPFLKRALDPILLFFQSVPGFILMPLFMIWFGHGLQIKILIIALSCYFPICSCFRDGLTKTPLSFLEQASLWKADRWKTFLHIQMMHALPSLFSGLKLTAIHAPLSVLAVDWIGASAGLGYLIMLAHNRLEMDLLFLSLLCILLLTFGFNRLVIKLEKHFVFWKTV